MGLLYLIAEDFVWKNLQMNLRKKLLEDGRREVKRKQPFNELLPFLISFDMD
jgi:hypothetical protein